MFPHFLEEGSKTSDRWLSKLSKGGAVEDALLGEEYEAIKRVCQEHCKMKL
jgi:hypothetical protein